ncbi:MAG TPA: hypothetical protein VM076_00515 [Gemmatimonadaceae bacterium]|nr:hypothetical protein [Gemmatimonadaceae bacterium]
MSESILRVPALRRALLFVGVPVLVILVTKVVAGREVAKLPGTSLFKKAPPPPAELVNVPVAIPRDHVIVLEDSLFGRSGKLRVRLLDGNEAHQVAGLKELFGAEAVSRPSVLGMATVDDPQAFSFITLRPWREKRGAYVGPYRMGWWPGERTVVAANYENPTGFIEVTPENRNTRLSAHFHLNDFLTHDQDQVWPKYVVLREALLDKLELVLTTMEASGVPSTNVRVLSGFRAPYYNAGLVAEGAARASRHQFGDASDIIIDTDHDGRMDDLNRDGRVDFRDTEVILRAVERVERTYPELVGGLGLYAGMGPSGPFAHIDVRGSRARWTSSGSSRKPAAPRYAFSAGDAARAAPTGGCSASGASAALCVGVK